MRSTRLIGDARKHDPSYTARRTYFAEPDDGSTLVRARFAAAMQAEAEARSLAATLGSIQLKGDPAWMRAANPLDGVELGGARCPSCGAGFGSANMGPHAGRLCGSCSARRRGGGQAFDACGDAATHAGLVWRRQLRGGAGAEGTDEPTALELRQMMLRPRDYAHHMALRSGRATARATALFDSAEERAACGFRDRGLRRAVFTSRGGGGGVTSAEAGISAAPAPRAGTAAPGPPLVAAGGPGGSAMVDWARWGRRHKHAGTHADAERNLRQVVQQQAAARPSHGCSHDSARSARALQRRRAPSRPGRWALAVPAGAHNLAHPFTPRRAGAPGAAQRTEGELARAGAQPSQQQQREH
eukprot:g7486.t1